MNTTDITTKSQRAAGYTVTRRSVNMGHGPATGVHKDRIECTFEIRHNGRLVDVVPRKGLALAFAVYEGRVCAEGADGFASSPDRCGGEDDGVVCAYIRKGEYHCGA